MDGVLVVDKEQGWTSHDVCAFLRSRFHLPKVGHAGTLDPMATGVLIILLGRATKLSQHYSSCDKDYAGTMRLGIRTDTHDTDGKILEEKDWRSVAHGQIEETFKQFQGEMEQMPPMVSALKHKGVRLYKLARQGKVVPREKRKITIHELTIKEIRLPEIDFFSRVSKGTYVRTLVNDIGESLGCYAVISSLRRLRCGDFDIEDAVTVPALKQMKTDMLGRLIRSTSAAYTIPSRPVNTVLPLAGV